MPIIIFGFWKEAVNVPRLDISSERTCDRILARRACRREEIHREECGRLSSTLR